MPGQSDTSRAHEAQRLEDFRQHQAKHDKVISTATVVIALGVILEAVEFFRTFEINKDAIGWDLIVMISVAFIVVAIIMLGIKAFNMLISE